MEDLATLRDNEGRQLGLLSAPGAQVGQSWEERSLASVPILGKGMGLSRDKEPTRGQQ